MKAPKFKTEAEEADWYYRNRHRTKWGKPLVDEKGKPMSPAQIVEAELAKRKQTKSINIRLLATDIERAKQRAEAKGIGYQTLIRMLLHEALEKAS